MRLVMLSGLVVLAITGCTQVTTSRPFTFEDASYLRGGFGTRPTTIIRAKDGSKHVVSGHLSTPARGSKVVIVKRWGMSTPAGGDYTLKLAENQ